MWRLQIILGDTKKLYRINHNKGETDFFFCHFNYLTNNVGWSSNCGPMVSSKLLIWKLVMCQEITHHYMPGSNIKNKELLCKFLDMSKHIKYSINFIFWRNLKISGLSNLNRLHSSLHTHTHDYFVIFIHHHPRDSHDLFLTLDVQLYYVPFFLLSWFKPSCFSRFLRKDAWSVSFFITFMSENSLFYILPYW